MKYLFKYEDGTQLVFDNWADLVCWLVESAILEGPIGENFRVVVIEENGE